MPRYVILTHDHPVLHWDFLLEAGGVLRTWRLLAEPSIDASIDAEPLADHRVEYLDYEGPVRGGRGTVQQWDAGEFDWLDDRADAVRIRLRGRRLDGIAAFRRLGDRLVWELASA